jgi:pimeloyl-ACP methyl ester carboxylesterase
MSNVAIDGIETRYEVVGSGPPLLLYAPGGFNATIEAWSTLGIYARIKLIDHLSSHFTCVLFDRRECGASGGRIEAVTWNDYVAQGKGLLDHLGIDRAVIVGGCMGCPPAAAFAVKHPETVRALILFWPVGGAKYRIASHRRFAEHLAFVESDGLGGVAALARREGKTFGADPRGGPWASVIKRDEAFARAFGALDPHDYSNTCKAMRDNLFSRDTAPGAEPEALMAVEAPVLIVPGQDDSHATSAARYLEECLPRAEYWDVPVERQTEEATNARIATFLDDIVV